MSAPVDDFDLDIRIGVPGAGEQGDAPMMFSHGVVLCITDSSKCSEYDCTTINKTC
jgi:hypothetical protein